MEEGNRRGKFLLLSLLLISFYTPLSITPVSCDPTAPAGDDYDRDRRPETLPVDRKQQELLLTLEELVKNLSEVVSRLESRFSEAPPLAADLNKDVSAGGRRYADADSVIEARGEDRDGFDFDVNSRGGEGLKGVSVTKYSPFWSEKFQFASALRLDFEATCINVLPFRDYEGLSKYVAIGDQRGKVYVFLRNGDVLVEFKTATDAPVTAMVSYMSPYKNESFLVTGHDNGMISVHKVWEGSNGEDWNSLYMENVGTFGNEKDDFAITILEVHHVGRTRYILSADISRRIIVFKENGAIHGSLKPGSRPLTFLKQRLLFLTETGAGSLDLRTMKLRESECEGLNHSLARNYVFDATERSKAYGYTSEGELIHVLLLGDIVNFKCRVRFKRKVEMEEPLAIQVIKGYLLVVNPDKVFIYNVSSQNYVRVGMPRLIFSAGLDEIRSSFVRYQAARGDAEGWKPPPLIATDREKVVVLGLGSRFVGIYRSNLPVYKGEYSTMQWTSPVLFFILFLFVAWHFFAKKKEALTSWGPDDPFSSTSATPGGPLVPSSGDLLELRGNSLRQPRRYGSPTRYPPSGATNTWSGSADHSSRPPVDPNYRAGSDLKYRAASLEQAGYPKRRENMFVSSQVVDDSS